MEVATMAKVAPLSISVSPRTYRNTLLTRRPSAAAFLSVTDHLTQQFRWGGGAVFASARRHQQQQQQQRWNRTAAQKEEAEEEMGGVGQAVLAALKSGVVPRPSNSRNSGESGGTDERRSEGGDGKEGKMETTLSGSDVLLALQRSKEAGRGKSSSKKRRRSGQRGRVPEDDEKMDYSNVRPLSINRDWGARLDEMEKRLQDLRQKRLS